MSGTEEDMPAQGPAAPADVARKSGRMYFWPLFILLAAAAAIFIYDLYWNAPAVPQRTTFRNMSSSVIQASSGFQNLISTLCWLAGFGFTISGGIKLFQMLRRGRDDASFHTLKEKAIFRLFMGFGFFAFPFIRVALYRPTYDGGGHAAGYPETGAACYSSLPEHLLTLCIILSMFFALAGARDLYRAYMRMQDEPVLAPFAWRTWIYFFLGVTFLVLPFLQAIYAQPQRPPVEYAYGAGSPYYLLAYSCTGPAIETRNFLRLVAALCWYCAALGFYFSHFALGKALRFRGTTAEADLNQEAFLLLLISFIVTTVPFACVAFTGVGLWWVLAII